MSTDQLPADDGDDGYFEGYSDYKSVSHDISRSVADAIDAYAYLQAKHTEGARMSQNRVSAARQAILSAALRLLPELEREKSNQDTIKEMYERWTDGDGDENAYIEDLKSVTFRDGLPDWLGDFVTDIRAAAFELGYLQAGRMQSDSSLDVDVEQTEAMFEEL